MKMDHKKWDMECYQEYLNDICIARNEIEKMQLMPITENIICDLYALPSHNMATYYGVVYRENDNYWIVYARPQIFSIADCTPINMYRFKGSKRVGNHKAVEGRITIGIKKLDADIKTMILDIVDALPKKHILGENVFVIDGVFQAIRVFKDGNVVKEVVYHKSSEVCLPREKEYMHKILDRLHIKIGPCVGFEMNDEQRMIYDG